MAVVCSDLGGADIGVGAERGGVAVCPEGEAVATHRAAEEELLTIKLSNIATDLNNNYPSHLRRPTFDR